MKTIATLCLALLAAFADGCADTSRSRNLADPAVPGRTLAQQVCANCHGQHGLSASENFPNLAAQQPLYLEAELRSLRDRHRRDPGGFVYMWGIARGLSDNQIAELAAYYAAQPAPLPRPAPLAFPGEGQALFADGDRERGVPACTGCHGRAGEGQGAFPRLAHQPAPYVLRQLGILRERADERPLGPVMSAVAHSLSDADMRALAAYIEIM